MAKKKITEVVWEITEPIAKKHNVLIFDIEYKKEGSDYVLRVYIEKEALDEYISITDCENVHRELSDKLDEIDPIENQYILEVSSPGLDRPLRNEADFARFKGCEIDVGLYKALNGSKVISGTLEGFENGEIIINDGKEIIRINQKETSYCKKAIIF